MGKVNVAIGGRSYPLLCGDGEEAHITALAAILQTKAEGLTASLGAMSEPRLLLMAGLQVADELFSARTAGSSAASDEDPRYAALLARIEAFAAMLDGSARTLIEPVPDSPR